jgi:hypothetical protein
MSDTITNIVTDIDESKCDCLNQSDTHTIKQLLLNSKANSINENLYLESSADEQLLLYVPFKNKVHIRTISFYSKGGDQCPSTIKLFVNCKAVDFDDVEDQKATEVIQLTQQQGEQGKPINLKYVNFRNVVSLTIFVQENHGGDTTILNGIKMMGEVTEDRSSQKLEQVG